MDLSQLNEFPKDSAKYLEALAVYVFDNRRSIPEEGLRLILEAEPGARRLGDNLIMADLLRAKAWCYYYSSDIERAVETATEGAGFGDLAGSTGAMFRNLIVVAYSFIRLGDLKQALDISGRCAQLLADANEKDPFLEGIMHSVFANIYYELNDMPLSRDYNLKAVECFRKTGTEDNLAGQISNLGNVERSLGNFEEAMRHYEFAREYYTRSGNHIFHGNLLVNIGNMYAEMKEHEKQMDCYREALAIFRKVNYQYGIMYTRIMMGKRAVEEGAFDKAQEYMDEAEKLASQMRSEKNSALILDVLADLERSRGNYRKAYEYFVEYHKTEKKMLHSQAIIQARNQQVAQRLTNVEKERELFRLKNIDLVNLNNEINQKNKDILDSINYARRIQHAMLPSEENLRRLLPDSFVFYQPRDVVSGDFFWSGPSEKEGETVFAVADCTGHGVPGALLSMLGLSLLNEIISGMHIYSPARILDTLRAKILASLAGSQVSGTIQDGMDIVCCRIDTRSGTIAFSGANLRLYRIRGSEVESFRGDKQPIGAGDNASRPFTEEKLEILPGDRIYLMTDGFADQFGGPEGKKLKSRGVEKFLLSLSTVPVNRQAESFAAFLAGWRGSLSQTDDICIAGLGF